MILASSDLINIYLLNRKFCSDLFCCCVQLSGNRNFILCAKTIIREIKWLLLLRWLWWVCCLASSRRVKCWESFGYGCCCPPHPTPSNLGTKKTAIIWWCRWVLQYSSITGADVPLVVGRVCVHHPARGVARLWSGHNNLISDFWRVQSGQVMSSRLK